MPQLVRNVVVTVVAIAALFWVVGQYETALRNPRFLDGWILAGGMLAQLAYHVRKLLPALTLGRAASWLKMHVYVGYFVIAAFLLHTSFSAPETSLEWVLWILFVVVSVSGVLGLYLTRAIPARLQHMSADQVTFEQIGAARAKLAGEVDGLMLNSVKSAASAALSDYYADHLYSYFRKPRHVAAHLVGSQYPLQAMCDNLDRLESQPDTKAREVLEKLKAYVVAKFDLDHQYALQGLQHAWLFIHIPATYCLIAMSVLHTMIVYAYSSGAR
ncbi:MAG: hypothetical protein MPJ78_13525 [Hyphomicrobiaceae bacterium]|nr:hypothetical protein [Hyphomicrobiaceae bacterium]